MVVGEQPGDAEDLTGKPFVGPSGALLDRALVAANIVRSTVYVTNAVKHFKYSMRGKRRIHSKPRHIEVEACHPWLEAEIQAIEPVALLLLGATAVSSLLGNSAHVIADRGKKFATTFAPATFVTVHPSAVLRAGDNREVARDAFFADVAVVGRYLSQLG